MAYEQYEWECGDIVTDEKLNNIEDGIEEALANCGGSPLFVYLTPDFTDMCYDNPLLVMDKSWQDIWDAFSAGIMPIFIYQTPEYTAYGRMIRIEHSNYRVWVNITGYAWRFDANNTTDYLRQACFA